MDKICEMAAVMQQAITIDEQASVRDDQLIKQLRLENETLRELLHISSANHLRYEPTEDSAVQATGGAQEDGEVSDDCDDTSSMNDTVIENKISGDEDEGPTEAAAASTGKAGDKSSAKS